MTLNRLWDLALACSLACDLLFVAASTNRMLPNREMARLGSPSSLLIVGTEKGPDLERGLGPFFFFREL